MKTRRKKQYECFGGPLCGQKMERPNNYDRFVYADSENRPHFYRLIKIRRNDHSAIATFFHYFGSNQKAAVKAHPTLLPPDRLYKKRKQ